MLRFFRKIRLTSLSSGNLRKYIVYAFGEILLVMIGILLAIQVNNCNDKRIKKDAELVSYGNIKRLLMEDQEVIKGTMDYNSSFLKQFQYAIQIIEKDDKSKTDTLGYITLKLTKYSDFDRKSNIYESIVNSGEINLLKNNSIKEGLQRLEETYIFFNRMETIHYDAITNIVPEFIDNVKYLDRKIVRPEKIFSLRLQNAFITVSDIMKVKDEIYNRALDETKMIIDLIDTELSTAQ